MAFSVYPNPSNTGVYRIEGTDITQVQVIDVVGKQVPFEWNHGQLKLGAVPSGFIPCKFVLMMGKHKQAQQLRCKAIKNK